MLETFLTKTKKNKTTINRKEISFGFLANIILVYFVNCFVGLRGKTYTQRILCRSVLAYIYIFTQKIFHYNIILLRISRVYGFHWLNKNSIPGFPS